MFQHVMNFKCAVSPHPKVSVASQIDKNPARESLKSLLSFIQYQCVNDTQDFSSAC